MTPRRDKARFDVPVGEAPAGEAAVWRRVAPRVAADLRRAGVAEVIVVTEDEEASAHVLITSGEGWEMPVWLEIGDDPESAAVALLNALLDSALFDDVTGPWPPCPIAGHSHSLEPQLFGHHASWVCESHGSLVARVGDLSEFNAPPPR